MSINEQEIRNDLYEAVNGEWTKTAQIPADKPTTGGFSDLDEGIEKLLMNDLDRLSQSTVEDPLMDEAIKYYQLVKDFKRRDQEGTQPMQKYVDALLKLQSYDDYSQQWKDLIFNGAASPVNFDIDADMKNARVYALFAGAPGLILPDTSYYKPDNEQGKQLLQLWSKITKKVLTKAGYGEEADEWIKGAIAFDALLVPHVKSAEESADYSKMYNPQSFEQFTAYTDLLDIAGLIQDLIGTKPDKIIVTEPRFYEALNDILSGNFTIFKQWLLVKEINGDVSALTDELRILSGEYGRALSGSKEAVSQQKFALNMTRSTFSQVIGNYYAKTYFGPEAKADVEHMVHQMVKVYEQRLQNNQWLSQATRDKAITKLQHLGVQVGYPDKIPAVYGKLHVDTDKSLLDNLVNFAQVFMQDTFSRYNKPVDRTRWEMSAATVNAYYHPFKNIIVFPAAILQAPFYSLKQSSSENYGGIGSVIAHEISHAFDNNGALFDEYGNLHNWWTDDDQKAFKQRAQAMIDEFDGIPYAGQKVNGKLTVSENIADAGGLSCALSAAQSEKDYDGRAFFLNWARIWRMKATTQYMQLLLSIDVHAPNKLRADVQVKNLDEFYRVFKVQEGDGMWLPEDKRVKIW